MIDLYTASTPNGRKVSVALEELELPYTVHVLNLRKGEQKTAEFLARNPNGKIPAIVDHTSEGDVTVFESGAILIYLAEKEGRFLPRDAAPRARVLEWLMFQMSAVGPMFGQLYYFTKTAKEPLPAAIERYGNESMRILGVLDGQLGRCEFLAGHYSIADMATYPWVSAFASFGGGLDGFANVARWRGACAGRAAVQRGMAVPAPPAA